MAYFPNGTSFYVWQERACSDCLNYRDNGSGSFGCAITDAHFLMADKMHDKECKRTDVFATLDILIRDETAECQMRLTAQAIEAQRAETPKSGSVHESAAPKGCAQ
jgi:hypothetical protein